MAFEFIKGAISAARNQGMKKPQKMTGAPESITGLRLNYVAMRSHFRFSLQEKNGLVLFSYNYLKKGYGYTERENVPVNPAYMQKLRRFVKENDYVSLTDHDPARRKIHIADAPSCHLTLEWLDYEPLLIRSMHLPPNGDNLKEFFIGIAESPTPFVDKGKCFG